MDRPQFTPALLLSVGLPFFLVTMGFTERARFATLQAAGYVVPVSALIVACGGWRCCWRRLGVLHLYCGDHCRHLPEPEAHRIRSSAGWQPYCRRFYLLAGLFGDRSLR